MTLQHLMRHKSIFLDFEFMIYFNNVMNSAFNTTKNIYICLAEPKL